MKKAKWAKALSRREAVASERAQAARLRVQVQSQWEAAEAALLRRKKRKRDVAECVEAGLRGDKGEEGCARWVHEAATECGKMRGKEDGGALGVFARLCRALAAGRSAVLGSRETVRALGWVAVMVWKRRGLGEEWVHGPEEFVAPKSKDCRRQFRMLVRHLFCRYPMPDVFDGAWYEGAERVERGWWMHVAEGKNLRTAEKLPFELTKRMAHEALRSPVAGSYALRYGQFVGMGVSVRLAEAAARVRRFGLGEHLEFFEGLARFLAANPEFPAEQVGPLVDYVGEVHIAPADGVRLGFSFRGRTANSLLRMIRDWHFAMGRSRRYGYLGNWPGCGIEGLRRVEGEGRAARLFEVVELLSGSELAAEGTAMRHCVAVYGSRCAQGACAIFSIRMTTGGFMERLLTVEVIPEMREIVQARGKCNVMPGPIGQRIMGIWVVQAKVKVRGC